MKNRTVHGEELEVHAKCETIGTEIEFALMYICIVYQCDVQSKF